MDINDFNPDLGEGFFSEDFAIIKLLMDGILFANSRKYICPIDGKVYPETIVLFVICNDVFARGGADAEALPLNEVQNLYNMHIKDLKYGAIKWVCFRRNRRPEGYTMNKMKNAGVWTEYLEALPE
jgi:hypothetical protein